MTPAIRAYLDACRATADALEGLKVAMDGLRPGAAPQPTEAAVLASIANLGTALGADLEARSGMHPTARRVRLAIASTEVH